MRGQVENSRFINLTPCVSHRSGFFIFIKMTNEELNTEILKVFGCSTEVLLIDSKTAINKFFQKEKPNEVIVEFLKNCTIDDFERIKLIATNYEVSTNF